MAALTAAALGMGALSFASAYSQAQDAKAQGEYQKQMYDTNARMAEMQADDAIRRGDKAAQDVKGQAKRTIGSQRAALAAQGVEVNSGSALDVQEDTAALGAIDALTIKNNAWREAWGYKAQALDYSSRGQMAQSVAGQQARNTMIAGGMSAMGYGAKAYGYAKG